MARDADRALLAEAHAHLERKDLDAAERVCKRLLSRSPNLPDALLIAAEIASHRGQPDRARANLRRILGRHPDAVHVLHLLGSLELHAGRPHDAWPGLLRAIQLEFGLPPATALETWKAVCGGLAARAPVEAWRHRVPEFRSLGLALELAGQWTGHEAGMAEWLAAVDFAAMPPHETVARASALLRLSGFNRVARVAWTDLLYARVVLPWLRRALQLGLHDLALMLESVALVEYVAQRETEAHFAACVADWTDDMRAAGRGFAQSAPSPRVSPARIPRVAFIVNVLSDLAHVRLMVDMLEGHAELAQPLIEPLVFAFRRAPNTVNASRLERLGIELAAREPATGPLAAAEIKALRGRLAECGVDAVIWVSHVAAMPFSFAMGLAPVQIWWSLKYHGMAFPEIHGYLTAGGVTGGTRDIGGHLWRSGPVGAGDWYRPEQASHAAALRGTYRSELLFGCFAREEKLAEPAFLSAVTRVLRSLPQAGFLWTGRQQHPAVQAAFDAGGVADRCHFIGWVNTSLYAQVIDLFLDSFPFPCGYTLYEAMAAARPAVLFASEESARVGARSLIEPLLSGVAGTEQERAEAQSLFSPRPDENLFFCARSEDEYVAFAVALGRDPALRSRAGAAAQAFVRRFMANKQHVGRVYARHIVELVEARARAAAAG
ncbi:MAG: tetratricopeptide repeat protein [Betaproteobacteria bacterium]